jgi:uncharacterized YigZ family protein
MDAYKTLLRRGSADVVINKSRFIGHGAPVATEEAALTFLRQKREEYKDASHNCFAYIIGKNAGIQRYSDDGEPGGTAGLPIIHVMQAQGVVDAVVVVTRYFGGILLGAGGLVRAYTQGAVLALEAGVVATMHPTHTYLLAVEYPRWGRLENHLQSQNVKILQTEFAADVSVTLQVKAQEAGAFLQGVAGASDGRAEAVLVEEGYEGW